MQVVTPKPTAAIAQLLVTNGYIIPINAPSNENTTRPHLRPILSAMAKLISEPAGPPANIADVSNKECDTPNPCLTRNVGTQETNAYMTENDMQITVMPTSVRLSCPRANSSCKLPRSSTSGATIDGSRTRTLSLSIADVTASASASRPTDDSHRGDSGRALRKYHTTSAPAPGITNIQRHPA